MNTLSLLSGILFIVGFVPYSIAILKDRNLPSGTPGKTEPSKATWIIWISLDVITMAGMIANHAVNFQIIGCVVGGALVMLLSIKYGVPGWTKLDKFCLGGAILGLSLWAITRNPMMGMATSLSVTFLGSFPTFRSAWQDYRRENRLGWTLFFLSCCLAVFAVPKFDMATATQPLTFFTIESIMMFILFVKPMLKRLMPWKLVIDKDEAKTWSHDTACSQIRNVIFNVKVWLYSHRWWCITESRALEFVHLTFRLEFESYDNDRKIVYARIWNRTK